MNIVGLDLGLATTGLCSPDGTTQPLRLKHKGVERLDNMFMFIVELCAAMIGEKKAIDAVVIEGYSFASVTNSLPFNIGELGGVVRLAVYRSGTPLLTIAPASLKKYATGVGNASKAAVVSAATQRAQRSFSTNDEADAWWLWAFAHDLYGEPAVAMPKINRVALDAYRTAEVGTE